MSYVVHVKINTLFPLILHITIVAYKKIIENDYHWKIPSATIKKKS